MFLAFFRLFKSLNRIALALESLNRLYKLDLESRGITETKAGLRDQVEITYQNREMSLDEDL